MRLVADSAAALATIIMIMLLTVLFIINIVNIACILIRTVKMLYGDFTERIKKMRRRKITQEEMDALLTGRLRHLENRNCDNLDFANKILHNVLFENCSFKKTKFDHGTMHNVTFEKCDLTNSSLTLTTLVRVRFDGCVAQCSVFNFNYCNGVSLENSEFQNSKFCSAQVHYFSFNNVNFNNADFLNVKFSSVHELIKTDLSKAKNLNLPLKCPEEGSFIGWKKCFEERHGSVIAKLLIPEDAARISGFTNKCRASKSKVLEFQDEAGMTLDINKARSSFDETTVYIKGKIIHADDFDTCPFNTCTHGIHFFMHRQEAIDY